jgi:hypothetical protein
LKDTDAAWAAGFMDGDGHIGLRMVPSTGTTAPRISAGQVIRDPLEELQRLFGGSIKGPFASKRGNSDKYLWSLSNTAEFVFCLEEILPYLRVKRRQAVLLLSYLQAVVGETGAKFNQGLSEDQLRQRISFFLEMKELNRLNTHRSEESND